MRWRTFLRATGSKSKTLIASFGLLISSKSAGVQIIGSGSFDGVSNPQASIAPEATRGLVARYCRNLRRLERTIDDAM
jgi:hypothetical protein